MKKTTHIDLVNELSAINEMGKYNWIIARALKCHYHDVLKPDKLLLPKVSLVRDLHRYPELKDLREAIIRGDYNESENPDEVEDLEVRLLN